MKRSGFKVQWPPRQAKQLGDGYTLRPREIATTRPDHMARMTVTVMKENPLQHAAYMNLVRDMACRRCGKPPRSQFCHSDEGKGLAIKSDCRLGWPGCAECHYLVGSTGVLGKAARRHFEDEASRATRALVRALALWPVTLPVWPEDGGWGSGDSLEPAP